MERLLVTNARLIDPVQGMDGQYDLLVEDGRIAAIGERLEAPGAERLDAAGLVLAPGLVDMHVHLRDPGFTHKEDILTGCAAAAAGGFTSVACMPNTNPVCDCPEVVAYIKEKAGRAAAKVYPIVAATLGLQSGERTDLAALAAAGAVGVSDDGKPVQNNRLLLETLREAQALGMAVICHAEDLDITNGGIIHLGEVSERLGVPGVDRASEDCSTAVAIALAAASETPVHIAHVSTEGAVALIRDAKRRGIRVTAETGAHYFALTHELLLTRDANFRMAPPLREERDRLAVLAGIADGTLDCIITDHAPHSREEKSDFEKAPNGVIGLETSLALCLTHLVKPGVVSLSRLIEMMSATPAKLLGIEGGSLAVGMPADFVLFDPLESWTVDKRKFRSKAENTCFDRAQLQGRVKYTYLDGKPSYQDNLTEER